jgi:hypothetical protein
MLYQRADLARRGIATPSCNLPKTVFFSKRCTTTTTKKLVVVRYCLVVNKRKTSTFLLYRHRNRFSTSLRRDPTETFVSVLVVPRQQFWFSCCLQATLLTSTISPLYHHQILLFLNRLLVEYFIKSCYFSFSSSSTHSADEALVAANEPRRDATGTATTPTLESSQCKPCYILYLNNTFSMILLFFTFSIVCCVSFLNMTFFFFETFFFYFHFSDD